MLRPTWPSPAGHDRAGLCQPVAIPYMKVFYETALPGRNARDLNTPGSLEHGTIPKSEPRGPVRRPLRPLRPDAAYDEQPTGPLTEQCARTPTRDSSSTSTIEHHVADGM